MTERAMTGRLIVDYRSLCGIAADDLRAARERWFATGEPIEQFADEAARWLRSHRSLADFPVRSSR
jgi:hypothetical protein